MPSAITGTPNLSASPTAYAAPGVGGSTQLGAVIQQLWSKEILFQAMPILRFEQFAVKKTELGVQPGLTVHFVRYNNLGRASQLVEGIRMQTAALTANTFSITVAEHGYAIAVSELLLNASFDDVMATASRLLGRNMATYLDEGARNTLLTATSRLFGYNKYALEPPATPMSPYDQGTAAANRAGLDGTFNFTTALVKDAVETLATKNVPRLGDSYVAFVHPHQSRRLRDDPQWIEMSKYAQPGMFSLGEIGKIDDVVFIETTQVRKLTTGTPTADNPDLATDVPAGKSVYQSIFVGDNAFGHAISLPVELRDGGILDFGREHALAWYSIFGWGLITDQSVIVAETN
ncbi:N4-gp56 family major capsid protein [Herbidospora galbida]|uniref:N4-gp56 family major capsid protein n=1 Tax=Herbidospora galbida TaxID=2575442 RepID=A0A4U3M6Y9_9ACTN|nr:N4-gp56 family major capsid protein [Herbidospora galbida]TKK84705.1 N4-gp56 family major capsid protein [Herbidospora galbida]